MLNMSPDTWEHIGYFLGGVVLAGILAGLAQAYSIRSLSNRPSIIKIHMKKDGDVNAISDGDDKN
jgi:hypothetical protein